MSPPVMAPVGAAGKEYKRESGTARLLGSGAHATFLDFAQPRIKAV